jgi:hypothetical protein
VTLFAIPSFLQPFLINFTIPLLHTANREMRFNNLPVLPVQNKPMLPVKKREIINLLMLGLNIWHGQQHFFNYFTNVSMGGSIRS